MHRFARMHAHRLQRRRGLHGIGNGPRRHFDFDCHRHSSAFAADGTAAPHLVAHAPHAKTRGATGDAAAGDRSMCGVWTPHRAGGVSGHHGYVFMYLSACACVSVCILPDCFVCRMSHCPPCGRAPLSLCTKKGFFIEARVCRSRRRGGGELGAAAISDQLPFLQYLPSAFESCLCCVLSVICCHLVLYCTHPSSFLFCCYRCRLV